MPSYTSTITSDGATHYQGQNYEETECVALGNIQVDQRTDYDDTDTAASQLFSSVSTGEMVSDKDSGIKSTANKTDTETRIELLASSNKLGRRTDSVSDMTKLQVLKNLVIICTSFFLLFTSFHSVSNLQSSLNKEEGVGTFSLVIVYVGMMTSSLFLSSVFIDRLGLKLTMCLAMVMYVIYMAANLYPVWSIMVPAALLCGLAAGPLWASQSSYISKLSGCYSKMTKKNPKDSLSFFFGIFYMCVNASKISGNLLASIVLKQNEQTNRSMTLKEIEDCVSNNEGAVENATTLERPDDTTIYIICGTWIGLGIAGIIVLAFLNSVVVDGDRPKDRKRKPICSKFLSTVKHLRNSRLQKILIPISLYYGISTGFLTADFTKSIVGCTLGIHMIAEVMLSHGIANTVCSALIGRLVKHVGHLPLFTFSFLCYGSVQCVLIVWKPGPEQGYLFFIFATMWGASDAILKTQLLAIYGHLFMENTEAAFGNYFVWEATGFITSLSYSTFASTNIKLYILLGLLVCSAMSYYTVEYIDRKQNRCRKTDTDSITDY